MKLRLLKNIALKKLQRQRNLKEVIALDLLEKQFSDQSIQYKYLFLFQ